VPQYPGLQHFSKPFDSLKCGSWQGEEIRGTIRTLAVHCASILVCSKDDGKTAVETASDEMVMGAVRALCEFSLLVSPQNHSDLSLKELDDALKRYSQKKAILQEQKMLKSAKAKVNDLLATESNQLCEPRIDKIRAAMEALAYGAEKVSLTNCRQFQVRLNRNRQAPTISSDADRQTAIARLEHEIHQVTHAKRKLFDKSFQHHQRQLLLEIGTKATGPKCIFTKRLAARKPAAKGKAYRVANMTADTRL
jgi:hypothetical protein